MGADLEKLKEDDIPTGSTEVSTANVESNMLGAGANVSWFNKVSSILIIAMFLIKGFKISGFEMSDLAFGISVVCFTLNTMPINMWKIFARIFGK